MKQLSYKKARLKMNPGDVIAFGGYGILSNAIKAVLSSNVSHVGVILQTNVPFLKNRFINQIIESTSLGNGFAGVQINRMSIHVKNYNGEIWVLPLKKKKEFDQEIFFNFLLDQDGKEYDAPQAFGSAIDFIPDNKENFDKLFCSELVAAAYEYAGIIGSINASEQTPADICELPIFRKPYQIKGSPKELMRT